MAPQSMCVLAALAAAAALTASGCGGSDGAAHERSAAPGASSGAMTLRSDLTALLTEHAYLIAIAAWPGSAGALGSPRRRAATTALEGNSADLTNVVGSIYGDGAGASFGTAWRRHAGLLLDYAGALAGRDASAAAAVQRALARSRQAIGSAIAAADPELAGSAVARDLIAPVRALSAALRADAIGSPARFALLSSSATRFSATARTLAEAIARRRPGAFSGSASSAGATLRAQLTAGLEAHVYLTALAILAQTSSVRAAASAAAAALERNSAALAGTIAAVYGGGAGLQFLALWRQQSADFGAYSRARSAANLAGAANARDALDEDRRSIAAFAAAQDPDLSEQAIEAALGAHVETTITVIEDIVGQRRQLFDDLRTAAGPVPTTAGLLADAIARQFPARFGPAVRGAADARLGG